MIKKLRLRDFQAHKKLDVELAPSVTTIVGRNDVGKSAVIRALRWVAFNRPVGQALIRDGATDAEVTVEIEKGEIVHRKGKGGNSYTVEKRDLGALGNDVPTRVTELLNVGPMNFQSQHDGPFWFSETAGEVSRQLNEIVNLGLMDSVLAALATKARQVQTEVSVADGRLAQSRAEREALRYVPGLVEELEGLELKLKELLKTQNSLGELRRLFEGVQGYEAEALRLTQRNARGNSAVLAGDRWAELARKRTRLAGLIEQAASQKKVAERRVPNVEPLVVAHATRVGCSGRVRVLRELVDEIEEQAIDATRLNDSRVKAQREFDRVMGTRCQLCGQKIES